MKNAVLRVSFLGNQIYLGTVSKKDPSVMNDSKVNFTKEAVTAVAEHMRGMSNGNKNEVAFTFAGQGKLVWVPEDKTNG